MLQLEKVNAYYDEFHVLKDVSLSVKEGQLVLLVGPNGHGKSTLLKTIAGLIRTTSGSIKFRDKNINNLPVDKTVEMGLTYISEERNLFVEMTVLENLKLGAYNCFAWPKMNHSLELVFKLFPRLSERKAQIVSTLSGGELRMLAIGRGLMSGASFLAIDEPSLGLSPLLTNEVFKKIKDINEKNITILLVEQNIKLAGSIANHIYLMEDGRITYGDTTKKAMNNPIIKAAYLGKNRGAVHDLSVN
ncbi:MAG: ABC transporter ATP-binding protein [Desulfobacterales bacterium]|nr:ABC transporter ATP-binding protein [Desulfobacterales bacterium]